MLIHELVHMPVFWLDVAVWVVVIVLASKNRLLR